MPKHRPARSVSFIPFEQLEGRTLMDALHPGPTQPPSPTAASYRSVDGSGNNTSNTTWGKAGTAFVRVSASQYADGKSAPSGSSRPSARLISNVLSTHPADDETLNSRFTAAFLYAWGQFLDHDIDLTNTAEPAEAFNIAVPAGDASFDPLNTGTQVIPLSRSQYAAGTGTTNARQQVNSVTSYIDASMVYGSDSATAAALRTFSGGELKTSEGNLMPIVDGFFFGGDVRANENPELVAMQTLFLREHNRLADQFAAANPSWNDERIYQESRRIVAAEIQSITFNEFLPALLGQGAIRSYQGYNSRVNAAISNEFATAAYRVGHTMIADDIEFMDNDGEETREEMELAEAFFNPAVTIEQGIDPVLKYLASSNSQEIDNIIVNGLRNFLFGAPGAGGLDLASLNVQRGRDHGLADYNTARASMGLPRVTSFAKVSSDPAVRASLQSLYGSVNNMDLWVAGLSEDHLPGSSVGPTFTRIIADQFTRLRDGDRFWYERDLSDSQERAVENTTLADIIKRNTTLTNLQSNVFFFDVKIGGQLFNDTNGNGRQDRREGGLRNRTVDLLDADGNVVDTVTTDFNGNYRFTNVQIGEWEVRPDLPTGWASTTADARDIRVTRGQLFSNVNFGQRATSTTPTAITSTPGSTFFDTSETIASDLLA